jgi:hypothetical protein
MLDRLTSDDFTSYLNQTFHIQADDDTVLEAELIDVSELGGDTPADREPFSIVLRGPADVHLPQRIYGVTHEKLGTLSLFLVPIGPDDEGMRFESIFT